MGLKEIALVFFVESIDEQSRNTYERDHRDEAAGVKVMPIFVETAT